MEDVDVASHAAGLNDRPGFARELVGDPAVLADQHSPDRDLPLATTFYDE
jgi:hypothetical protein